MFFVLLLLSLLLLLSSRRHRRFFAVCKSAVVFSENWEFFCNFAINFVNFCCEHCDAFMEYNNLSNISCIYFWVSGVVLRSADEQLFVFFALFFAFLTIFRLRWQSEPLSFLFFNIRYNNFIIIFCCYFFSCCCCGEMPVCNYASFSRFFSLFDHISLAVTIKTSSIVFSLHC